MTRWPPSVVRWALYSLALVATCGAVAWGCYATTGPVTGPNPADYPPLTDNTNPIDINEMRRDR